MTLHLDKLGRSINKKWILKDVSLKVKKGECLALLGPSGCGKSTTLRLIAGLDMPTEGKILLNNNDITDLKPSKRKVGMVFQSYALFPHLTISENLVLGLKIRKISKREQYRRVSSVLSLLQLEELADRRPSSLSGGQRQRVALARSLLREPEVYLLDEPMSNLDEQLREEIRPELKRLILSGGQPVVYVTHDQHEAMAMSDKIAVLNNGKLEQIGSPKELYENPLSLFVASFIGRPQVNIIKFEQNKYKIIRPEDIFITDNGIKAKLIYKEWLGNKQVLLVSTLYGDIRLTCNSQIEVPESLEINWQPQNEKFFDITTGLRI